MGELVGLLGALSHEPAQRGREFERITKWFLENDPRYRAELADVWLWDDWPGRWAADAGIDLVAKDRTGSLWAIQAKAYSTDRSVTKADVDTFLSESSRPDFSYRLLVATTDRIGANARRTLDGQEKPTGRLLLGDLAASPVSWPSSPRALRASKPARKLPRPHQRAAIRDVLSGFSDADRGKLVMACGTGKTLVSLQVAEQLESRRVLVLLPSLSLLSQTLTEWTTNAKELIQFLAVCSDEKVVDEDAVVASVSDLGFPVTTEPDTIARFLRGRSSGMRVVFSTYQSSPRIAQAMTGGRVPGFDLAIADEAHRVAGRVSGDFATILDGSAIRARKRMFMTATPRYFTGRLIREAREADFEVASMDDESTFGRLLHRLTFAQAIEQDLLTDYQVVIVGVDDDTYLKWAREGRFITVDGTEVTDARTLVGQIGLAKAMRRYDLRRTITFHSRVAPARRFAYELPRVVAWMPARQRPKGSLVCDFVSGAMNAGDRNTRLQRLRDPAADRALLSNARCLTEGIDVPTLDAVAFIDPRRSEVDIVQAVGRAIRKSPDKKVGTIVIPVFIGGGDDPEAELDSSVFKPVWDVLNALRAHDEELAEQLDALRRQIGVSRGVVGGWPEKIQIDMPRGVSPRFSDRVQVMLVENTTASWEAWYARLLLFVEREGHALVPGKHQEAGFKLGSWVSLQRNGRLAMNLSRRERLENVPGWTWNAIETRWEHRYGLLRQFARREEHARVPAGHVEDNVKLGYWVIAQRGDRDAMEPARRELLEMVPGWSWHTHDDAWQRNFQLLQRYVDHSGHSRVPFDSIPEGVPLGKWVAKQRASRSQLPAYRVRMLEGVPGWTWDALTSKWSDAYSLLIQYVEREGSARVPVAHVENGFRLGGWVDSQRQKRSRLTDERKAALQSLPGWTWTPYADRWEQAFATLQAYAARESDSNVPREHEEARFPLGRWVNKQRTKRTRLADDRVQRLEALPGWTWSLLESQWVRKFHLLSKYVSREGHARVPQGHLEDGFPLGIWVASRRAGRSGLSSEHEAALESLPGWRW